MQKIIETIISMLETSITQLKDEKDIYKVEKAIAAIKLIKDSDATTPKEQQTEINRILEQFKKDMEEVK